jgi:hypothetical protein
VKSINNNNNDKKNNDIQRPYFIRLCLKEHLLSTLISAERFRRRKDRQRVTTAIVCSPFFFLGA